MSKKRGVGRIKRRCGESLHVTGDAVLTLVPQAGRKGATGRRVVVKIKYLDAETTVVSIPRPTDDGDTTV